MVNVKEAAPESEEQKIKHKCNELRKRIQEVEECNEISLLALSRTRAAIRRSRLQYTVLLERLSRSYQLQTSIQPSRPSSPIIYNAESLSQELNSTFSKSHDTSETLPSNYPKIQREHGGLLHDSISQRSDVNKSKWDAISTKLQGNDTQTFGSSLTRNPSQLASQEQQMIDSSNQMSPHESKFIDNQENKDLLKSNEVTHV